MAAPMRFGGLTVDHPDAAGRARGDKSQASLTLFTAQGHLRKIELSPDELLRLVADGAKILQTLLRSTP